MLRRFPCVMIIVALVCTFGRTSALANTPPPTSNTNTAGTAASPAFDTASKKEAQPNEKLRTDVTKLIADAKAGKVTPAARPQIQPAQKNNLSKGTKIAIGVGIALAVVAIVIIVNKPRVTGSAAF